MWTDDGIRSLFVETHEFPEAVSIHLWESVSWPHIEHLNYNVIMRDDTSYNLIARRFVGSDAEALKEIAESVGASSSFENVIEASRAQFEAIYERKIWGEGSGVGSSYDVSKPYIDFLTSFISLNEIKSVVDFGCGDWQFSQYIDWSGIKYLGFDVVRTVVQQNNEKYSEDNISFREFRNFDEVPSVDLIVAKEVLQHLPNVNVVEYIGHLREKCRFLLLTNDETPTELINTEIGPGGWRSLRLDREPFTLNGAYVFSYRSVREGLIKSTYLIRGSLA